MREARAAPRASRATFTLARSSPSFVSSVVASHSLLFTAIRSVSGSRKKPVALTHTYVCTLKPRERFERRLARLGEERTRKEARLVRGASVCYIHLCTHIHNILYKQWQKKTTTSHYMRHWNLYIMNELKEESLLNNYLVGVINPRSLRRSRAATSNRPPNRMQPHETRSAVNIECDSGFLDGQESWPTVPKTRTVCRSTNEFRRASCEEEFRHVYDI